MRHHIVIVALGAALGLSCILCASASAQETGNSYLAQHLRAPAKALELKVGTGYTQGFGNVAPGRDVPTVAGAGLGVSADIDYRLSHFWSVGVEGQYQEFTSEQNTSARGIAANLGATYHFNPTLRGDPWARLGTGYRVLYENDPVGASGTTQLRHGFELLAAKVGYDVRVSEDVAIAPVIGADLNMFVWENPSSAGSGVMASPQVATFVYAGLQGRFDIGGTREDLSTTTITSAVVPPPPPPLPPPPPPAAEVTRPVTPSIAVSEDILRECKVDLDSIEKAPKFDFDQTDLLPADLAVLKQIAECFTTGPMKGMGLALVGRADPRGAVAYNQTLGWKRAGNVAAYLESLGVEVPQIEQSSRGKLDATGYDEATWALDRRVDISIGGRH
jgi:outer membrane protein OmpA-like peptidoglycan-associated protein